MHFMNNLVTILHSWNHSKPLEINLQGLSIFTMYNPSFFPASPVVVTVSCPSQGKCYALNVLIHIYQIHCHFYAVAIKAVPVMTRTIWEPST